MPGLQRGWARALGRRKAGWGQGGGKGRLQASGQLEGRGDGHEDQTQGGFRKKGHRSPGRQPFVLYVGPTTNVGQGHKSCSALQVTSAT